MRPGLRLEIIKRSDPAPKGFLVQPKRWLVERTFGWLMQDRILTDVYLRCDALRTRRHRPAAKTNRELAEKYRISPRTVTNWRREGCPFAAGQTRVLPWIARRRYAPAGTKAKFAMRLPTLRFKASVADFRACMQEARKLKLATKLNGIELPPDDWLRRLRCPRQR